LPYRSSSFQERFCAFAFFRVRQSHRQEGIGLVSSHGQGRDAQGDVALPPFGRGSWGRPGSGGGVRARRPNEPTSRLARVLCRAPSVAECPGRQPARTGGLAPSAGLEILAGAPPFHPFNSFFSSLRNRQSVPWVRIF
jgi:hypothetical protein